MRIPISRVRRATEYAFHPVNANYREQQRDSPEYTEQNRAERTIQSPTLFSI